MNKVDGELDNLAKNQLETVITRLSTSVSNANEHLVIGSSYSAKHKWENENWEALKMEVFEIPEAEDRAASMHQSEAASNAKDDLSLKQK